MIALENKVAVVTGAASGIGLAIAERLAAAGMKIVLADVEAPALSSAESGLREKGATVLAVRADVSSAAEVEDLAARAWDAFGAVHVLCNNAGVGIGGLSWEHSLDDWAWVLGVNLWGVIHGIRSFVPRMLAQRSAGHIVNTSSFAGLISNPFFSVYGATKHAVVAISESLKMELDALGAPLGVSVLCPGFVATRMGESARNRRPAPPAREEGSGGPTRQSPVMRDFLKQQIATGIDPRQVADAVVEAILDDRFYIVTPSHLDRLIRLRMERILERKPPRYERQT